MAQTGGTAAPRTPAGPRTTSVVKTTPSGVTIRHSAAAQALGAPKGGAGKPLTVTPQAQPKPSKVPKMPAAHKAAAQHRAPAPRAAPPRSQFTGQNVFNPLAGTLSSPQLERLSQNITRGQMQNELEPLQRQGREIQNTEGRVQGAYAGAGQTQQNLLGGIETEAQANAKTASNLAAENALKVSKGIETSGQQQASMTAGYMSPELRQELAAGAERGAATGVAGTNFAAAQGLNEQNYMGNLRAAAAARTTEGGRQIAGIYGKQLGTVRGKEAEAIARQPTAAKNLAIELGQKQFTDLATSAGLPGVEAKIQALRNQERQAGAKNRLTERGQNVTRANAEEGAAQREKASERTATTAEQNRIYKTAHSPGGKPGKPPKAPSPAEGRKYMGNLSKAEGIAQQQLGPRKYDHARQEQVRKYLRDLGYSDDQVSAGMNLAVYGKLGPQDQRTANAYGLNRSMRPQWFGTESVTPSGPTGGHARR